MSGHGCTVDWTFKYLFDDDGDDYQTHVSACLHFVQTVSDKNAGVTLDSKVTMQIGPPAAKKSKNKNKRSNKKCRNQKEKEENDFLDQEQEKVRKEKEAMEEAAKFSRTIACNSFVTSLNKLSKKLSFRSAISALKGHCEAIRMITIVLGRMFMDWTYEARMNLGTHVGSTCALAWNVEENRGWWRRLQWRVRTHSQFRFMRVYFSMCLESKRDSLTWTHKQDGWRNVWSVKQPVACFIMQWDIELVIHTSVDLFANPAIVPMAIGQVMVPPNVTDVSEHFHICKQEPIVMQGDRAIMVMRELLETLVDRKLTSDETSEFELIIKSFWSVSSYRDMISFVWTCSYDGIFLMAGVYEEDERKRPHVFVSTTGFGGFPDLLPVSKLNARKMVYFCSS